MKDRSSEGNEREGLIKESRREVNRWERGREGGGEGSSELIVKV